MVGQWKEITLNWTSSVVQCVDFKSVEMLQSRAPSWSRKDLKSVRKGFRLRQIFPLLEDPALRDQVESAVCSQGPILTLRTFAQDARLLQLRVRGSLSKLVLGLQTENEDTLRTRTCDLLSEEIDQMSLELGLPNPSGAERHALIKRCYQHIFLHAIRTRASITRIHLSAVVEQELVSVHVHERGFAPQNQLTEKDVIATRAPADNLPDVEVDDRRRHGHLLFKHATATKHLYCDRINDSHVPSLILTQSSMAKHIVRVFLFGRAAFEPTQMPTPGLLTSIAQSASTAAQSTPFDISPITTCASSSIHSLESPVWTATPPIRDVRRGRAEASIAMVKSMAASLFDTELLPASSSPTSNRATIRRPASVAMLDPPHQEFTGGSRLTKRPRCRGGYFQTEGDALFLDTANPHHRRRSGSTRSVTSHVTSMVSPSLYSVDGRSSISRPDDGRASYYRFDIEQDYVELLREYNPYAGQSDHVRSQSRTAVSSPPYTSNPTIPRPAPIRPRSGTAQMKTRRQLQTAKVRKPIPRYVLYRSVGDENKVLRVPRTKESTIRFVASQRELDPKTKFLYLEDEESKHVDNENEFMLAVNAEDLYQAIDCLDILTVFVDSDYLRRA